MDTKILTNTGYLLLRDNIRENVFPVEREARSYNCCVPREVVVPNDNSL